MRLENTDEEQNVMAEWVSQGPRPGHYTHMKLTRIYYG